MQGRPKFETYQLDIEPELSQSDSRYVLPSNTTPHNAENSVQQNINSKEIVEIRGPYPEHDIEESEKLDQKEETKRQKYARTALLIARASAKACAAMICVGVTSSLAFAIQNDEDMHLLIGLQQNSDELDFSGQTGCDILQDASVLSKGEMSAKKIRSAAYENELSKMISAKPIEQYYNFFKNFRETYRSNLTGIEYRLYLFDQNESRTLDNTNLAIIEQIEMSIFKDSNYSDHPTTRSKIACMRADIVNNKSMNGRVIPLVVPADPACFKNKITYDIDDCNQIGFTMPFADFDYGPWDLNPVYDEFIILTTGNDISEISNEIIGHELIHKFYEGFRGGEYELNLPAEEKFAKFAGNQLANDIIFEALPPMITYNPLDQ